MKRNAFFEDGSIIIEDGLSRTPVGVHKFEDVDMHGTDAYAFWVNLTGQA